MAKRKRLHLKIVFDSNIIYNIAPIYLVNKPTHDLIQRFKDTQDLMISWYLPEIVIHERTFQMEMEISKYLPTINKIERTFGIELKINSEFIHNHIAKLIDQQIEINRLSIVTLDNSKVIWNELIQDACFRRPPFEHGEKEKGFKDSLILECLMQLVKNSPASTSQCRFIFVTSDLLLIEATEKRVETHKNVTILNTLPDLENFINLLLTSEINEKVILTISAKVDSLFFTKDELSSVYYKLKITDLIYNGFSKQLKELPPGGEKIIQKTFWIGRSVFIKKVGQKVYWKTQITAESEVSKSIIILQTSTPKTYPNSYIIGGNPSLHSGSLTGLFGVGAGLNTMTPLSTFPTMPTIKKDEIIQKGMSKFEINWITTVSVTNRIKFLKIENINFIETTWENV